MKKQKPLSRKKFLGIGLLLSTVIAAPFALLPRKKKKEQADTARMLTEDGRLVEIDLTKIPSQKQKIDDQAIHTWIKNKPSL